MLLNLKSTLAPLTFLYLFCIFIITSFFFYCFIWTYNTFSLFSFVKANDLPDLNKKNNSNLQNFSYSDFISSIFGNSNFFENFVYLVKAHFKLNFSTFASWCKNFSRRWLFSTNHKDTGLILVLLLSKSFASIGIYKLNKLRGWQFF